MVFHYAGKYNGDESTEPAKAVAYQKIPEKPVMTPEAATYPKLKKIKAELDNQNNLIFKVEQQRGNLEIELSAIRMQRLYMQIISRKLRLGRKSMEMMILQWIRLKRCRRSLLDCRMRQIVIANIIEERLINSDNNVEHHFLNKLLS